MTARSELKDLTETTLSTALDALEPSLDESPNGAMGGAEEGVLQEDLLSLSHAKVMIVDDEPMVIEVLQTFLQEAGFTQFIRVIDSSKVLPAMRREPPDLLLLDLHMPVVSGFDVLSMLKRDVLLRHVPVIILTAESDPRFKLRALALGATDFLIKPVDSSELQLRVRNALSVKMYRDRLVDYDALTGLLSRKQFRSRLGRYLEAAKHAGTYCVLAHVDLDRFKNFNETFGHQVADRVLREAAERLRKLGAELDVADAANMQERLSKVLLGRVSGNGFVLMLGGLHAGMVVQHAVRLAQRIQDCFAQPFHTRGQDVFTTASIGLAIYPDDGMSADAIMANAELAMYQAKQRGRNGYEFVTEGKHASALETIKLESDLRRAIERRELCLFYQPRVDIASNRIVGVEALVRWRHPSLGMISPGRFIPLAEESGLIVDIGRWVIQEACSQLQSWAQSGLTSISVSVNVSAPHLRFQRVRKDILSALELSGFDARLLIVELTESMLMDDVEDNLATMNELHALGVRLAIDDFGTGYSSLAYLTRFPVSELKIDRSFVQRATQDQKNGAIVSAIIAMGRELGLATVAEGVETREQLSYLRDRQCDQYQGFLFSRPAPPAQLEKLLEREKQRLR